jgi:hypothetical protein
MVHRPLRYPRIRRRSQAAAAAPNTFSRTFLVGLLLLIAELKAGAASRCPCTPSAMPPECQTAGKLAAAPAWLHRTAGQRKIKSHKARNLYPFLHN